MAVRPVGETAPGPGGQELILTRGEAAEFDTRVPHSLSAAGARPAQVISIFNDDGVRMHTHTASS